MAASTFGFRKTRKKSECFWKHGYNYGHLITYVAQLNRERERNRRPPPEIFATVQEAFESMRQRHL